MWGSQMTRFIFRMFTLNSLDRARVLFLLIQLMLTGRYTAKKYETSFAQDRPRVNVRTDFYERHYVQMKTTSQ